MKILNILILFFLSAFLNAQSPQNITIQSCTNPDANGTYTKGPDKFGCDCYDKDSDNTSIYSSGSTFRYDPTFSCSDLPYSKADCLVSSASCNDILSGDTACSSCAIQAVLANNNIPTLSQWGLIILGFCLAIIGFVAVQRKRVSIA